jgi:hypothetical protein
MSGGEASAQQEEFAPRRERQGSAHSRMPVDEEHGSAEEHCVKWRQAG